jgi:hypothetical protein
MLRGKLSFLCGRRRECEQPCAALNSPRGYLVEEVGEGEVGKP